VCVWCVWCVGFRLWSVVCGLWSVVRLRLLLPGLPARPHPPPVLSPAAAPHALPSPPPPSQSVTKDGAGAVASVAGEFVPDGDFKKTKYKLTWLAQVGWRWRRMCGC
jgi:hypothetical protein